MLGAIRELFLVSPVGTSYGSREYVYYGSMFKRREDLSGNGCSYGMRGC